MVLEDWKKACVSLVFKKRRKKNPGNLDPWEGVGKSPASCFQTQEGKQVIRVVSMHFKKEKSPLTNLSAFYSGMAGLMDQRGAVDVLYLDLSKTFDSVHHNIFIDNLGSTD